MAHEPLSRASLVSYLEDLRRAESEGRNFMIEKYARGWRLERISRVAAAIMRCAMCEILYMDDVPNAAAINEAVELAKGYEEPETVAFINGVLGSFVRGEVEPEAEAEEASAEAPADEPEQTPENGAEA